jgi:hypothetical protein
MAMTNAQKQARFKVRHKVRLRLERERAALTADPRRSGPRPSWICIEWVHDGGPWDGLPACVFSSRITQAPPAGLRASDRWLPRGIMPKRMAERIVRLRRAVICQWAGGVPDWFQPL